MIISTYYYLSNFTLNLGTFTWAFILNNTRILELALIIVTRFLPIHCWFMLNWWHHVYLLPLLAAFHATYPKPLRNSWPKFWESRTIRTSGMTVRRPCSLAFSSRYKDIRFWFVGFTYIIGEPNKSKSANKHYTHRFSFKMVENGPLEFDTDWTKHG